MGGALAVFGGAPRGAPIACFVGGSGRKRGPEIDHPRRLAGARCENRPSRRPAGRSGESDLGAPSRSHTGGPISFRRRVAGRPDGVLQGWIGAKTGPGNRPSAPTGGGPSFRLIPLTRRPISGRCGILGFRETLPGNPERRISGSRREVIWGGPGVFGGAFSGGPIARFGGVSGRTWGPKIDHPRRPAGAQVSKQVRPQVARFRADSHI